jgi:uncharacterized membrane protein YdfJ with MMPL/SSD domain
MKKKDKKKPKVYNKIVKKWREKDKVSNLVNSTTTLKNAKGSRLDAIIAYSNSDGLNGIKIDKNASDEDKRIVIAQFYAKAAENDANNLDEIIEDALDDYVPDKKD